MGTLVYILFHFKDKFGQNWFLDQEEENVCFHGVGGKDLIF